MNIQIYKRISIPYGAIKRLGDFFKAAGAF